MPFPKPTHAGHTLLGYRGISIKHYLISPANKAIQYNPPPPAVAGASQLGAGVYITEDLRTAQDYAQDSGWNYYCSRSKGDVDDHNARESFEHNIWKTWGKIHAVFIPTAKYESTKSEIADFSHVNIDKTGDFVWSNIQSHYNRNSSKIYGIKTQLNDGIQLVIYPPHTQALYIKDITEVASKYLLAET